jgi:hypothetical protein
VHRTSYVALLLSPAVFAAEPAGHYDPARVAAASSVFRAAGEANAGGFEALDRGLKRTDEDLAALDLALALLRGTVDEGQLAIWRARLDERSAVFGREFGAVEARFDQIGAAYESAFGAAQERAIAAASQERGGPLVECAPQGGLAALGAPGGGPACPGPDVSDDLARRWDGDALLREALAAVQASSREPLSVRGRDGVVRPYEGAVDERGWPVLTGYAGAADVLALRGLTPRGFVDPARLGRAVPEIAEAIDRADELAAEARQALKEATSALPRRPDGSIDVDAAGVGERLAAISERARGVRKSVEEARARAGALLWDALDRVRKSGKKAGWDAVGACVNPERWGACTGDDKTDAVEEALLVDKKLARDAATLRDALAAPDTTLPR